MQEAVKLVDLKPHKYYRINPCTYPRINFFEDIVDSSEMDLLYEIERSTNEDPCEITMRVYQGNVLKEFHDIRVPAYQHLHHPSLYQPFQEFGKMLRAEKAWRLIYHSVRHEGGVGIAGLRPPAISIPMQATHLRYYSDGNKITVVFNTETVMTFE